VAERSARDLPKIDQDGIYTVKDNANLKKYMSKLKLPLPALENLTEKVTGNNDPGDDNLASHVRHKAVAKKSGLNPYAPIHLHNNCFSSKADESMKADSKGLFSRSVDPSIALAGHLSIE